MVREAVRNATYVPFDGLRWKACPSSWTSREARRPTWARWVTGPARISRRRVAFSAAPARRSISPVRCAAATTFICCTSPFTSATDWTWPGSVSGSVSLKLPTRVPMS